MLVRDVMATDLVTVPVEASLREAVEDMLHDGVGSVLVTSDGDPAGIVTETDVLQAGYVAQRPFADIPIAKVMSRPLVTVPPDATVRSASERMRSKGVKKLPVVDGLEVVGIVTTTDLVFSQSELVKEVLHLERGREVWTGDPNGLDDLGGG